MQKFDDHDLESFTIGYLTLLSLTFHLLIAQGLSKQSSSISSWCSTSSNKILLDILLFSNAMPPRVWHLYLYCCDTCLLQTKELTVSSLLDCSVVTLNIRHFSSTPAPASDLIKSLNYVICEMKMMIIKLDDMTLWDDTYQESSEMILNSIKHFLSKKTLLHNVGVSC